VRSLDPAFWSGRSVFVTGHMGFKGSWLAYLLSRAGSRSTGFGRDDRETLLYRDLSIGGHTHVEGDVRDLAGLSDALRRSGAEIVFHLAAQPIVLKSYEAPVDTFADNIMGTVHVLEAARSAPEVKAVIVVTSDKVYRNEESGRAFREGDPLGGKDPYSASKAAAEIVAEAMALSFFRHEGAARIAAARAGNVIGGGDWAEHRLLPDAARALARGTPLQVRNPGSVRPWQHVLEPLCGYLLLAEDLVGGGASGNHGWNFGPAIEDAVPAATVADRFVAAWGAGAAWQPAGGGVAQPAEAGFLSLDSSLARRELGWLPAWNVDEAVARTAAWYRDRLSGLEACRLMDRDIDAYPAFSRMEGRHG
jgi:CDP-glucose 4,6-dehydratase